MRKKLSDSAKILLIQAALFILLLIFLIVFWRIVDWWEITKANNPVLPGALLTLDSVVIAAIVTLMVGFLFGEAYITHSRFQRLGINDADPNREGRSITQNYQWMERIRQARRSLTIAGVTNGGWFVTAWPFFYEELPEILARINVFHIYFLDPRSRGFDARAKDEELAGEIKSTPERMRDVLTQAKSFWTDERLQPHLAKVKIYLYRGTPLSVVKVDDTIYFAMYLPRIKDSESPELMLKVGGIGTFSEKISESLDRLCSEKSKENNMCEEITGPDHIDEIIAFLNAGTSGGNGNAVNTAGNTGNNRRAEDIENNRNTRT